MIFAHLPQAVSNPPTDVSALESSISALERAISALDKAVIALNSESPPWEFSLWVFTSMVIVGVALELWVIRHEWRDDMEAWALAHFGVLRFPGRPLRVKLWVELASVLLITVGVLGELVAEIHIESINSSLRGIDISLRSKNSELRSKRDQLLALVTQQAGEAKDSALIAKASAKAAGIEADKAERKADSVEKQADQLSAKVSSAETELKAVDARRAELEQSLRNLAICSAPRVLQPWAISGSGQTGVDPLRAFAGYKAIIEFVSNDAEAKRAALSIAAALRQAQWDVRGPSPAVNDIPDGVSIDPFEAPEDGSMMTAHWRSIDATAAVVTFLHSYFWIAKEGFLTDEQHRLIRDLNRFPPDSLRIRVGLYPPVSFVTPPGAIPAAVAAMQFKLEREKINKQWEEQRARNEAKRLKTLTPEQAKQYKADEEKAAKELKRWQDLFGSPCQPLNPLAFP